jgi:TPR repeat protein
MKVTKILVASIFLILLFDGCQHSKEEQVKIFNESADYYNQGYYEKALDGFEDLCNDDNVADACYYAGNCILKMPLDNTMDDIEGGGGERYTEMDKFYEKGCELGNEKACVEKNKSHTKEEATSFLWSFLILGIIIYFTGTALL